MEQDAALLRLNRESAELTLQLSERDSEIERLMASDAEVDPHAPTIPYGRWAGIWEYKIGRTAKRSDHKAQGTHSRAARRDQPAPQPVDAACQPQVATELRYSRHPTAKPES